MITELTCYVIFFLRYSISIGRREHNKAKTVVEVEVVEVEVEPVSLKTAVCCCWKVEFVLYLLSTFQFLISTVYSRLLKILLDSN